jgi:hypothetical protein
MPTPTYRSLANLTLGANSATVTFSNIPQTYRDLIVVINAGTTGTAQIRLRLNGDATATYNGVRMSGEGVNPFSNSYVNNTSAAISLAATPTATALASIRVNIFDYSTTDKQKTMVTRADAAGAGVEASSARWANTAAVSSVSVFPIEPSHLWRTGATFSLYGVIA